MSRRARKIGILEPAHPTKRGVTPTDRRPAQADRGIGGQHARRAGVTLGIGGQAISGERRRPRQRRAAARREGAAEAERVQRLGETPQKSGMSKIGDLDHRRHQHEPLEWAASRARDPQHDRRPHGMA
jgi:hypothetical protein